MEQLRLCKNATHYLRNKTAERQKLGYFSKPNEPFSESYYLRHYLVFP